MLETDDKADHGGDDHGDEDTGFGQHRNLFHRQHQDETKNRHGQGGQVRLGEILQHFPDILEEKVAASLWDAEQHVQLGKADDDRRGVHETQDDRMRDEIDYAAEFDHAKNELDEAHQQGKQQGQTDIFFTMGQGQWRDGGGGHQ